MLLLIRPLIMLPTALNLPGKTREPKLGSGSRSRDCPGWPRWIWPTSDQMYRHLAPSLRTRWDQEAFIGPSAGGTITQLEDAIVGRSLQGVANVQPADLFTLQTGNAFQQIRCLDPGSPEHQFCRDGPSACQQHALRQDFSPPYAKLVRQRFCELRMGTDASVDRTAIKIPRFIACYLSPYADR